MDDGRSAWRDFFVAEAGASAALAGLLFVAGSMLAAGWPQGLYRLPAGAVLSLAGGAFYAWVLVEIQR